MRITHERIVEDADPYEDGRNSAKREEQALTFTAGESVPTEFSEYPFPPDEYSSD